MDILDFCRLAGQKSVAGIFGQVQKSPKRANSGVKWCLAVTHSWRPLDQSKISDFRLQTPPATPHVPSHLHGNVRGCWPSTKLLSFQYAKNMQSLNLWEIKVNLLHSIRCLFVFFFLWLYLSFLGRRENLWWGLRKTLSATIPYFILYFFEAVIVWLMELICMLLITFSQV